MLNQPEFHAFDKNGTHLGSFTEVRAKQAAWRCGGYVEKIIVPTPIREVIYDKRDVKATA